MSFNFYKWNYFGTEATFDFKRVDNFLDNTRGTSDFYVSVAHRTISVKDKPVFDA